jgi:sugar phosphate permease
MDVWSTPTKRRWIVWGALALGFLLVNVHRLSTAVLSADLMRAFETTGASLGTLHSAYFYVYAPMQVGAGVLADRLGIRQTATAGTVVMSLGAVAFGLAGSYPVALLARIVIGLGGSVLFIATLRFCANWFRPDEFATMSGLTIAIAGVGGILATTPLAVAVTTLGLRWTLVGIGLVGLAIAVVVWALARDTPATAGLEPVDDVPESATLTLREVATNVRTVFSERETWLAGLALFTSLGINITVIGLWGLPYVADVYELSVTAASTLTLLGSLGLLVGPPAVGRLSDRLGRRTDLMVAGAALYTLAFATLAIVGRPPLPVVGVILFSVSFLAGGYSLGYAVIKDRHRTAASGVATGAVNAVGFTGAAVFPTVMGLILDVYWTGQTVGGARVYTMLGYRVMFGLAAAGGFASLICVAYLHLRTRASSTPDGGEAVSA